VEKRDQVADPDIVGLWMLTPDWDRLAGAGGVAPRRVPMADPLLDTTINEWLDQALALPEQARGAFVARIAAGDEALAESLTRLLAHAARTDGFLDRSPLQRMQNTSQETDSPALGMPVQGMAVGAYRLVRKLGAGGMGEVWLAERALGGFRQQVAIKLMQTGAGMTSARFDVEREILAGLEHPSIARLYDGGVSDSGRPFMAMEYVEGSDLLTWCRERRANLQQRLAQFLPVCDAVAYAHAQLVVHLDIKPANILVNTADQIKLLDFGIAKLLSSDRIGDATRTAHLSPAYAAPEQLTGGRIGTAADVHALGATLYQLLTERLPWPVHDLPLGLAVERLLNQTPPLPSAVATTGGPVPVRALKGDLDAIIAKALRRDPAARYPDARALGEDLRRYLAHESVHARSGARTYVAMRFLRRNWLPVSAASLLITVIAATAIYSDHSRREARAALSRADAVRPAAES
jgi:eukaryotic-like serine/threonine-protein kinase